MESLALFTVAFAIVYHAWKGNSMSNFARLTAALAALSASISEVAVAIRNPQTDNNDQTQIDQIAGTLEAAAEQLHSLSQEEDSLDTGVSASDPSGGVTSDSTSSSDGASTGSTDTSSSESSSVDDSASEAPSDEELAGVAEDEPVNEDLSDQPSDSSTSSEPTPE